MRSARTYGFRARIRVRKRRGHPLRLRSHTAAYRRLVRAMFVSVADVVPELGNRLRDGGGIVFATEGRALRR